MEMMNSENIIPLIIPPAKGNIGCHHAIEKKKSFIFYIVFLGTPVLERTTQMIVKEVG